MHVSAVSAAANMRNFVGIFCVMIPASWSQRRSVLKLVELVDMTEQSCSQRTRYSEEFCFIGFLITEGEGISESGMHEHTDLVEL